MWRYLEEAKHGLKWTSSLVLAPNPLSLLLMSLIRFIPLLNNYMLGSAYALGTDLNIKDTAVNEAVTYPCPSGSYTVMGR